MLGDLLHAREGRAKETLEALARWRAGMAGHEVLLVRGNHDARAGDPPREWRIDCVDAPAAEPPFILAHIPAEHPAGCVLAGHVHPAVRLYGPGKQTEKLPCFHFGPRTGLLPAFGSFTGTVVVRPRPGDRAYAIAAGEVYRIA